MHPSLRAISSRWEGFEGKVRQRIEEVITEADASYERIIRDELSDPTPLSGVSTALKARLLGIHQKIQEAFSKLDAEMDQLSDASSEEVVQTRDHLLKGCELLFQEIERYTEVMIVQKEAQAGRSLQEKSRAEIERTCRCECGAALWPSLYTGPSHSLCARCGVVSLVQPGPLTMRYAGFFHALAKEAALPQWVLLLEEERSHHATREKSVEDIDQLEARTSDYWRAYVEAYAKLDLSWTPEIIEAEHRAKMGHFYRSTLGADAEGLRRIMEALSTKRPDGTTFLQWLKIHSDRPASQSPRAMHPQEPKIAWLKKRLADVDEWLSR